MSGNNIYYKIQQTPKNNELILICRGPNPSTSFIKFRKEHPELRIDHFLGSNIEDSPADDKRTYLYSFGVDTNPSNRYVQELYLCPKSLAQNTIEAMLTTYGLTHKNNYSMIPIRTSVSGPINNTDSVLVLIEKAEITKTFESVTETPSEAITNYLRRNRDQKLIGLKAASMEWIPPTGWISKDGLQKHYTVQPIFAYVEDFPEQLGRIKSQELVEITGASPQVIKAKIAQHVAKKPIDETLATYYKVGLQVPTKLDKTKHDPKSVMVLINQLGPVQEKSFEHEYDFPC